MKQTLASKQIWESQTQSQPNLHLKCPQALAEMKDFRLQLSSRPSMLEYLNYQCLYCLIGQAQFLLSFCQKNCLLIDELEKPELTIDHSFFSALDNRLITCSLTKNTNQQYVLRRSLLFEQSQINIHCKVYSRTAHLR